MLPGNKMLDDIHGGAAAGHAGEWVKHRQFSNTQAANEAEKVAQSDHSIISQPSEEGVVRVGHVLTKIRDALQSGLAGTRNAGDLHSLIESLEAASLLAESIYLDQNSLLANSNLVEIARVQASARLALVAAKSALAREESRGAHHRTDFPDANEKNFFTITPLIKKGQSVLLLCEEQIGQLAFITSNEFKSLQIR